MNGILKHLMLRPKILFLVDGIGASITAFFLFAVLRTFHEFFGMPRATLTYLSVIAVIFCIYSISCYFLVSDHWRPFLSAISTANLLYCCLTLGLIVYHYQSLTALGITYFLVEIALVCMLVFVEIKALGNSSGIEPQPGSAKSG